MVCKIIGTKNIERVVFLGDGTVVDHYHGLTRVSGSDHGPVIFAHWYHKSGRRVSNKIEDCFVEGKK